MLGEKFSARYGARKEIAKFSVEKFGEKKRAKQNEDYKAEDRRFDGENV